MVKLRWFEPNRRRGPAAGDEPALPGRDDVRRLLVRSEDAGFPRGRVLAAVRADSTTAKRRRAIPAWARVAAATAAVVFVAGSAVLFRARRPGPTLPPAVPETERFELIYANAGGAPADTFVYHDQGAVFVWADRKREGNTP